LAVLVLAVADFAGLFLAGALLVAFPLPFAAVLAGGLAEVALSAGDFVLDAGALAVVGLAAALPLAADDFAADDFAVAALAGATVVVFALLFVAAFVAVFAAVASAVASLFADSPFRMAEVALFTAMMGPLKMALRRLQETRACCVRIGPSGAVLNGETPP
jgi:hypothetical protein